MISGLHQPYSRETAIVRPLDYVFHQSFPDSEILHGRINSDRPDAGNNGILPEEIAADYSPVNFGHDRVDVAPGEEFGQKSGGNFRVGKIMWEVVLVGNRSKGFIAD